MNTRLTLVLALASLLALPSLASAQARRTASSGGSSSVGVQGLLGLESGNLDGLQLRGDVDVGLTRLSPAVELAFVGSISYSNLEHGADNWEFVPGVRFLIDASPRVGVYGDVGLGMYHLTADWNDGWTGATMRIGGGIQFHITPRASLVADAALHPHWGDYDDTQFTLLGGFRYQF